MTSGTTWTYAANAAWDDHGRARKGRVEWRTTVITSKTRGDSTVAVVRGWPTELAWYSAETRPGMSAVFCSGGRVYHIDAASEREAAAVADSLLAASYHVRAEQLMLDPPLFENKLFARTDSTRSDTFYAWLVDRVSNAPRQYARFGARRSDSIATLTLRSYPDHQTLDVVSNVGITRYVYSHHGTLANTEATLVGFHRAVR